MKNSFSALLIALCSVAVLAFLGAFAANLMLPWYRNDPDADASRRLWRTFALSDFAQGIDSYTADGRFLWHIRDIGLKTFAVCFGLMCIVAVVAAALDAPLESSH